MIVDCHMHTSLCGHAVGMPEEYVAVAATKGIELMTFTCHIPMDFDGFGGPGIRMHHDQLPQYLEWIEHARSVGQTHGIDVLCGIEAEVFPDPEIMEHVAATIDKHDFDFVLGSLHTVLPAYQNYLSSKNIKEDAAIIEQYFTDLSTGVASGLYDSMSHPDVVKLYEVVKAFEPEKHESIIKEFLRAAASNDCCIEVNTSGLNKGPHTLHPDPLILTWAAEIGNRITLGSDAHKPEGVGQHFEEVLDILKVTGFTELNFYQSRNRLTTPISEDGTH